MPLFFFDLAGHEVHTDEEGTEFPDVESARVQGVLFAGEYLREHPELIWDGREIRTIVRDKEGHIALTIVTLAIDGR